LALVVPAKAGTQRLGAVKTLGPGFRRDDSVVGPGFRRDDSVVGLGLRRDDIQTRSPKPLRIPNKSSEISVFSRLVL